MKIEGFLHLLKIFSVKLNWHLDRYILYNKMQNFMDNLYRYDNISYQICLSVKIQKNCKNPSIFIVKQQFFRIC